MSLSNKTHQKLYNIPFEIIVFFTKFFPHSFSAEEKIPLGNSVSLIKNECTLQLSNSSTWEMEFSMNKSVVVI